jgi:hypothetical protein
MISYLYTVSIPLPNQAINQPTDHLFYHRTYRCSLKQNRRLHLVDDSTTTTLQLYNSATLQLKNYTTLQVRLCKYDSASTTLQVRLCKYDSASTTLQVRLCKYDSASTTLQVRLCEYGSASSALLLYEYTTIRRWAQRYCKAVLKSACSFEFSCCVSLCGKGRVHDEKGVCRACGGLSADEFGRDESRDYKHSSSLYFCSGSVVALTSPSRLAFKFAALRAPVTGPVKLWIVDKACFKLILIGAHQEPKGIRAP